MEEIKQLQDNVRDEAARLGEDAEDDEDDAQVQGQFIDVTQITFFLIM